MTYMLGRKELDEIEAVLQQDLSDAGVDCIFLIDMAGNVIAALAAGNFAAVSTMARIIGEDEFSLLFHKGEKESIHFSKVLSDFLLITIFGKGISLGFLRLKVAEATEKIKKILEPFCTP